MPRGDRAIQQVQRVLRLARLRVETGGVVQRAEVVRTQPQCRFDVAPAAFLVAKAHLQSGRQIERAAVFGIGFGLGQGKFQRAAGDVIGARMVAQRLGAPRGQHQCLEFIRPRAMRGFELLQRTRVLSVGMAMPREVVMRFVQLAVELDRALEFGRRPLAVACQRKRVRARDVRLGEFRREFEGTLAGGERLVEHVLRPYQPPQQQSDQ